MIVEPWMYGAGTGISPLAILLSALFWSWLWGPIGLVLATPMTVCLVVMGKYIPQLHFLNLLFSDAPGLPPPARLYQRLLARDQDEAWSVVNAELGARPMHEIHDSIVLPALSMAEHDRQRGTLDEEAANQILENVRLLLDEIDDARAAAPSDADSIAPLASADLRVLCLPARWPVDVVAAEMLARVLVREGAKVKIAPLSELVGETLANIAHHPADIVFISAVPPSGFMHVRYICKRLAKEAPDIEIIVGMWTLDLADPELVERMPKGEHVHLVASFGEALILLRGLSTELRMRRESQVALATATD